MTSSVTFADGTSVCNLVFTLTPSKTLLGGGQFKVLLDQRLSAYGVASKKQLTRYQLQGVQQGAVHLRYLA